MQVRGPISPSIFKRHPLTGEPIEPVGKINDKYVWPIMGGAPDPVDDDDDGEDEDESSTDTSGSTDDGDSDSGGDSSDTVSRDDFDALLKRMKAADRRAAEAEKKIKDQEDAKKGDLERAQTELEEVRTNLEEAQKTINTLRLQNTFLTANKHSWHNPDVALSLAQSNGYLDDVIDEDGVVDKPALSKALDKMAKEHAYLVKSKVKSSDTDDDAPSGSPAGGRSDNAKDKAAERQKLKSRFPALR